MVNLATESSTTDAYYTGHYIVITAGKGAGQTRKITAYIGCDKSDCDPMQGPGNTLVMWSSTDTQVGTTLYCDCSADTSQVATVAGQRTTPPDTTRKYSIFMYRVEMNSPIFCLK